MPCPDSAVPDGVMLTEHEAFLAITDYIWRYAQRAGDDLITLLGDTSIGADGGPTDPAAWADWRSSVDRIMRGVPPRGDE